MEYERIKLMHHQEHLLKENNKRIITKWQKARKVIKAAMESLPQNENNLLTYWAQKEEAKRQKRNKLYNIHNEFCF